MWGYLRIFRVGATRETGKKAKKKAGKGLQESPVGGGGGAC